MTARCVLIAGPTASGKSALALALARQFDGIVINADSMQVYRELAILTARPSAADMAAVPHRLYGTVPAGEAFSVGRWLAAATAALAEAERAGKIAILVGGTGLYFRALEHGLAGPPAIPGAVRSAVRDFVAVRGAAAAHAELARLDPDGAARLAASDPQRIARALEVVRATGRPLAAWHRDASERLDFAGPRLLLQLPRDRLYRRCNARLAAMFAGGAFDEVRALLAHGLDPGLPAMKALGVREIADALSGRCDRGAALQRAQTRTRRYAKRQLTWQRGQMCSWTALSAQDSETLFSESFSIVSQFGLTPSPPVIMVPPT